MNAAVLFRRNLTRMCDLVLYIHAPFWVRYRRARERDQASFFAVVRRLGSQRDVAPQFSGMDADKPRKAMMPTGTLMKNTQRQL